MLFRESGTHTQCYSFAGTIYISAPEETNGREQVLSIPCKGRVFCCLKYFFKLGKTHVVCCCCWCCCCWHSLLRFPASPYIMYSEDLKDFVYVLEQESCPWPVFSRAFKQPIQSVSTAKNTTQTSIQAVQGVPTAPRYVWGNIYIYSITFQHNGSRPTKNLPLVHTGGSGSSICSNASFSG